MTWFVSEAAEALFGQLDGRWGALEAWGVGDKVPSARRDLGDWREFRAAWQGGDEDPGALAPLAATLRRVETDAKEKGFSPSAEQVVVPGLDELDARAPLGSQLQDDINAAEQAAHDGAAGLGGAVDRTLVAKLGDLWDRVPLAVKVGGGLLGLGVLAAKGADLFENLFRGRRDRR